jgi:hypothetical protein
MNRVSLFLPTYTNSINDCNTSLVQDAMNRVSLFLPTYTNSINDCNTSLVQDAMNRVSTMSICRILFSKWYYLNFCKILISAIVQIAYQINLLENYFAKV